MTKRELSIWENGIVLENRKAYDKNIDMFKAEEKIRRQLMKTIKKTILSFTLVFFMMILPVGDSAGMVTAQAQTMVYVTPTGSKYHTHKCGRGNFYQTTLSNALARGLTPCK